MIFRDRREAGQKLAEMMKARNLLDPLVLAIPRGGVPIGCELSKALHAPFDLIVPRKLPIPYNPEAGFGAVTPDGTVVLNDPLVKELGLSKRERSIIS
jgi:putative phosphoribosyl transferase